MPRSYPPRLPLSTALAVVLALAACDSSTGPRLASCDPGEGVQLQVGGSAEYQGEDSRIVCVTAPEGGAEYVLVTFAANTSANQRLALAIRGENTLVATAAGAEAPAVGGAAADRTVLGATDLPDRRRDHRLDRTLRDLERRELSGRIGPGLAAGPPETSGSTAGTWSFVASGDVPAPGDLLSLNTQTDEPCENPRYRTGRVVAVSQTAIVVADTLNPSNGFTDDRYEHFAATFDTLVGPLGETNFGTLSDIDGNERTTLFFTQEVNRLSESGSDMFIGGFFFARDLFPRESTSRFEGCANSNEAELLYLMVPDPSGTINGNPRSLDFVERVTLTTMIHELQHLINAAQRLHIIESAEPFEEVWLNEGLSHIAEELLFYETTGFTPGQNLGASDFPDGSAARQFFNRHQVGNLFRLEEFLEDPVENSPYNSEDLLATRGAAWHFLRYAADRRGGNQATFLRGLVISQRAGLDNLGNALTPYGPALSQWFTDWSAALYADDRVPGVEGRHLDPSWNHRSLFAAIYPDREQPFPLRIRNVDDGTVLAENLLGGGAAYFRFGLEGGATGLVELTTAGGFPPPGLRATLLRVN